jgi:drug/metabolite transporter (DMT)-like permease
MNPPAKPRRFLLILAFAALYLIWGSTYLGIRVAVDTIPPFFMAGMRFAFAGVSLFGFLILRGAAWPTRAQWRDNAIAGVFLLLGGNALVSWAELRTTSGLTALILGASPLIMVIMDWMRPGGTRPTAAVVTGMFIGIAGVILLLGPGALPPGARPPGLDIAVLLLASVSWWTGSLYSKHSKAKAPLIMASAVQMVCGSVAMLLVAWIRGETHQINWPAISIPSWLAFAYLVIIGSLVAFPTYVWLLEHSTPAKVSTYAYVNPVVAMFLGWAILDEPMNLRIVVAAFVIIGAVAIITIGKSWSAKKA